jgi:PAS domain S-box-containing protein
MKQNQAYVKAILDHSPESIVLIGLNHEILAFNRTIRDILKQYHGKKIKLRELYYPTYVIDKNKKLYLDSFNKAIHGESVVVQNKTEGKDFSMWFEYRLLPVYDDKGKLYGVSLSAKNIDEQKKAEEEIKLLNESLEIKIKERTAKLLQTTIELEKFNHMVSHDLQQPLVGVNMILRSILDERKQKIGTRSRVRLQKSINSINDMSLLIKKLLELSKYSNIGFSKKRVKMNRLVEEICNDLILNKNTSNLKIVIKNLPDSIYDPILIRQVWMNLISNAIKYSSRNKKALVEISCKKIKNENVFIVKDNGIGFDMKFAENLFVVFNRMSQDNSFEGTGVGLSIVHSIICQHGGRIWAEAEKNKGAAFYFTLN